LRQLGRHFGIWNINLIWQFYLHARLTVVVVVVVVVVEEDVELIVGKVEEVESAEEVIVDWETAVVEEVVVAVFGEVDVVGGLVSGATVVAADVLSQIRVDDVGEISLPVKRLVVEEVEVSLWTDFSPRTSLVSRGVADFATIADLVKCA